MDVAEGFPRTAVPRGVAAFLPDLAARKRRVEESLLATFAAWGYGETVPPLFEYLEVLAPGISAETATRGYKVEDRQDGRLMVLRPDVTAQLARLAAARELDPATPHRFGYATNVFTHVDAHLGRPREVFQAGVELLAADGVAADVEVLALLVTALAALPLHGVQVAVGHTGFVRAAVAELGLPDPLTASLVKAIQHKDPATINALATDAGLAREQVKPLTRIPFLIGGDEVFAAARALSLGAEADAAVDHLQAVVAELQAIGLGDALMVDLGEVRQQDYYTGIVFDVMAPSLGVELGGGGRYDGLMGRFGHPMPATGFALDVERLMAALGTGQSAPLVDYVLDAPAAVAYPMAARLRAGGLQVAMALPGTRPPAPVLTVADGMLVPADGGAPMTVEALISTRHSGA